MMRSNWLQGRPRREGVAWQFCKNQIETDRVARETSEGKDKIKSNKGTYLKGPSVTQLIMSLRRKNEKEGDETPEEPKSHKFGGEHNRSADFGLNIWKL